MRSRVQTCMHMPLKVQPGYLRLAPGHAFCRLQNKVPPSLSPCLPHLKVRTETVGGSAAITALLT
jgi:hypothetical protein